MKFLIDECLPPQMAGLLRAAGHDCAHVYELGLGGQPDELIMARADREDAGQARGPFGGGVACGLPGCGGRVLLAASVLVAFLVADHSSSDSSASSVIAIGLGGLGFLAFVLSGVLLGVALARLWRRVRRPVRGTPGGR